MIYEKLLGVYLSKVYTISVNLCIAIFYAVDDPDSF